MRVCVCVSVNWTATRRGGLLIRLIIAEKLAKFIVKSRESDRLRFIYAGSRHINQHTTRLPTMIKQ